MYLSYSSENKRATEEKSGNGKPHTLALVITKGAFSLTQSCLFQLPNKTTNTASLHYCDALSQQTPKPSHRTNNQSKASKQPTHPPNG